MTEPDGDDLLIECASALILALERERWDVAEKVLAVAFTALGSSPRRARDGQDA
jgi:hypothetical protein